MTRRQTEDKVRHTTTRRGFVQDGVALAAMLGLGVPAPTTTGTIAPAAPVDYYDKLGVPKIINAAGTYTYLTASIMPAQVQAAIDLASRHNVRLRDLQAAAGEYLATQLKCEAALVSSGAAAALTLGVAACMTRGNPDGARDVPARAAVFPHEVIIQTAHRFVHEHALEMCGATLVEVTTLDD